MRDTLPPQNAHKECTQESHLFPWAIAGHQEMAVRGAVTFEADAREKKYKIVRNLSIVLIMENWTG